MRQELHMDGMVIGAKDDKKRHEKGPFGYGDQETPNQMERQAEQVQKEIEANQKDAQILKKRQCAKNMEVRGTKSTLES